MFHMTKPATKKNIYSYLIIYQTLIVCLRAYPYVQDCCFILERSWLFHFSISYILTYGLFNEMNMSSSSSSFFFFVVIVVLNGFPMSLEKASKCRLKSKQKHNTLHLFIL